MSECKICGRSFSSNKSLVQHTENTHGRSGVYKGVSAWERSRNQSGQITTGVQNIDYCYEVDYSQYDSDSGMWCCGMCNRQFEMKTHLEQHLNSGTHEQKRYECQGCSKQFTSLAGLTQHLEATGHSRVESRLVNVMLHDAQQANLLMLTNGTARLRHECTLYFDGSAIPNPCDVGGCGWYLTDHNGCEILRDGDYVRGRYRYGGVTNNQAEYTGLINGLKAAINEGVKRLRVLGDSELVINQVNRQYKCNHETLRELLSEVDDLVGNFQSCDFQWIPRSENTVADALARRYSDY